MSERAPLRQAHGWQLTVLVVCLGIAQFLLQILVVRPHLPPAGLGATVGADSPFAGVGRGSIAVARPPTLSGIRVHEMNRVEAVQPGGPAANAGVAVGDAILRATRVANGGTADLMVFSGDDPVGQIRAWREAYWLGLDGPLRLDLLDGTGRRRVVTIERPSVGTVRSAVMGAWLRQHLGLLIQLTIFITCSVVLLILRPRDLAARLAIASLVFAGTAAGGVLLGAEAVLPIGLRQVMTVFSWIALPMAFPVITFAIAYFPGKSGMLVRHPWLYALPFLTAAPIFASCLASGLFIAGMDELAPIVAWDATHPSVFFTAFAIGLAVNVAAMGDAVWRFKHNPDAQERRRVSLAVMTAAVGTLGYVVKDGLPALGLAVVGTPLVWPWWVRLPLFLMVSTPAIGVTYAVAVHRVMAPRVVIRTSVQYALARKTLMLAAVLPGALLVLALFRRSDESLAAIIGGQPLAFAILVGAFLLAIRYRDRALAWLDRRFFRAEYDARAVLVSLAGRIPFETDPNELTSLVLSQIDHALAPTMATVLVSGVETNRLTPVGTLRGHAESLPETGGISTLLQWSDEPLELDLNDTRSPARRLPADEITWLEHTGAALFVPLFSKEGTTRTLLGAIVLGAKRSEEPYTDEDRQLLASIAAQVSLGLDVARLRKRETRAEMVTAATPGDPAELPVAECPTCRTCYDSGTHVCPTDRSELRIGAVPRTVDAKYRVDRLLGAGGMGAVYQAHDMRLDRDVAIKVVRGDLLASADARARFRREAQLVARLQHPGIVSVFDYGTLPAGGAFLVMEFVRGRDLRALVKEGAQRAAVVTPLLVGIAEPVEAAHRMGVLHRDLKPENILLPEQATVIAKVLDFGIAKAIVDSKGQTEGGTVTNFTTAGHPIGTPAYMAPEQLSGGATSERTDVYALGVIGFELLTGELPFGRGSFVDIAMRQQQGVEMSVPDLPEPLRQTVLAALSANPAGRPATARAFADALRGVSG
jgi:GAF domain-containing protein/predicted Ser/Thr protein kinase